MPKQASRISRISALELTMRDALDGLDDFACGFVWDSGWGDFEILAIEAPAPAEAEECAA